MTDLILDISLELAECFIETVRQKDRIITKTGCAPRTVGDHTFTRTINRGDDLAVWI